MYTISILFSLVSFSSRVQIYSFYSKIKHWQIVKKMKRETKTKYSLKIKVI